MLIALRRGCRQCIMVGDQQQLPATVFSTQARAARYDRSLFQRLIETGHPYIMLDTQYRMCPQISAFPSRMFYKNQLKDGENVTQPTYLPPFLSPISSDASRTPSPYPVQRPPFTPFMFLDLQSSREKTGASGSQSNIEEVRMCITLIKALIAAGEQAGCASIGSIGVISFYSDQVNLLRSKVHAQNFTGRPASTSVSSSHSAQGGGRPATPSSSSLVEEIDMNTVDGFQGKENDIIIISAVRANDTGTVGFLSDLRRLNVGLTRARKGLFVIGHAATLRRNRLWRELIDHAEAQKVLVSVPHPNVDLASVLQYHRQRNEPRAENRPGSGGYSNASKAEWGRQKQQDPRDLHNEYVPYSGVHSSFAGPNDGTNPNSQNNYTSTNTTADSQASRSNDRNFVVSDTSVGWVNDAPGNFSGEFSNTLSGEFSPTISSHSSRRPPPPPGPPPPAKRPVLHAISSSYASSHSSKDRDYSLADAQHFHQTQQHAQLGTLGYDTSRAFPSVATSAAFGAPQSSAGSNPSSRQSSRPGSRFGNIASLEETAPAPPDAAGGPTGTGRVQQLGSTSTRGLLSSSSSGASATIHKRKANVLVVEELEEGEVIDLT